MDLDTILVTGAVGIATSAVTAYLTAHLKLRSDRAAWRRELTIRLAEASVTGRETEQALARQFALGILVFEVAGDRHKIFIASNTRITAGRAPDNTVHLPIAAASKHHFALFADDEHVHVEDLGAQNGVFVNGERVSGRRRLEDFDVLSVGCDTKLTFHNLERGR